MSLILKVVFYPVWTCREPWLQIKALSMQIRDRTWKTIEGASDRAHSCGEANCRFCLLIGTSELLSFASQRTKSFKEGRIAGGCPAYIVYLSELKGFHSVSGADLYSTAPYLYDSAEIMTLARLCHASSHGVVSTSALYSLRCSWRRINDQTVPLRKA